MLLLAGHVGQKNAAPDSITLCADFVDTWVLRLWVTFVGSRVCGNLCTKAAVGWLCGCLERCASFEGPDAILGQGKSRLSLSCLSQGKSRLSLSSLSQCKSRSSLASLSQSAISQSLTATSGRPSDMQGEAVNSIRSLKQR